MLSATTLTVDQLSAPEAAGVVYTETLGKWRIKVQYYCRKQFKGILFRYVIGLHAVISVSMFYCSVPELYSSVPFLRMASWPKR